jgi:hypothetical protein
MQYMQYRVVTQYMQDKAAVLYNVQERNKLGIVVTLPTAGAQMQ